MKQTWQWYSRMLQLLIQDQLLLLANKQYPSMTKFIHWKNPYKLQHASYSETSFYQRNLPIQLPKLFCNNGVNYHLTRIAKSGPLQKQTKKLKIRSSGTNHSHLEFQYQQPHLFLRDLYLRNHVWWYQSARPNWWTLVNFWMLNLVDS